jgi:hypothetical protein
MDLGTLIFVGLLCGLGLFFHALKIGVKRLAGYDIYVDLTLSFLLMILFHGTQAGMVVALIGGLFISITLRVMRWTMGYQKLGWYKVPYKLAPFLKVNLPRMVWWYYPPLHQVPKGLTQQLARQPILT